MTDTSPTELSYVRFKLLVIRFLIQIRIMGRIRSCGLLGIFTVAFLLFLAPALALNLMGTY